VLEAFEIVKISRDYLPKVTQPAIVMQSTHDHIVPKNNLENIFKVLRSAKKKKVYIEKAYHTFISDIKNEHVFQEILKFISEN
jgi:carboxylesterase